MPFTLRRARRREPSSARSIVDVVKATIRAPQCVILLPPIDSLAHPVSSKREYNTCE